MSEPRRPDLTTLVVDLAERPWAYGLDSTYRSFVSFVYGFEWGSGQVTLAGMASWLDERFGHQRLAWEHQVLLTAFPDRDPHDMPGTAEENRWAIDAAVVLLRSFLDQR